MGSTPSAVEEENHDQMRHSGSSPRQRPHSTAVPPPLHGDEVLEPPSSQNALAAAKCDKERKKKVPNLSSLKRKIVKRRRSTKALDHAKAIRELIGTWNPLDVYSLVEEYDALSALKELTIQTDLARPCTCSLKSDLFDLFEYKFCSDVELLFDGTIFPAHRSILSLRCPYFRELFIRNPISRTRGPLPVKLGMHGVSVGTFAALLRYLYTGEFNTQDSCLDSLDTLIKLGEKFGTPNALEHDFRRLLETEELSDAVLVFTSDVDPTDTDFVESTTHCRGSALRCHKAILSARSPFFRNMLRRRHRSGNETHERTLPVTSKIVLDESVIPKKYAQVLLYAIYQDVVELSLVLPDSPSVGSLGEAQAMASGKPPMTRVEQAMELYQIAQFLELTSMAQGCESLIASSLNIENLVSVLNWSSEPHGSRWVYRQAMLYLREEFIPIVSSPVLYELNCSQFMEALKSDFLQASEAEILKAVVKWGEYQLIRRMEEREPNLLSNTQHSVSRKGIKRRDLDNHELREIISDLLPLVRLDHIIPRGQDTLASAVKRGLIPTPPSHMLSGDDMSPNRNPWIRGKSRRLYARPRLFTPYVEEAKAILDDQMVSDVESVRLRFMRMSYVPDTLYMVEDRAVGHVGDERHHYNRSQSCPPSVIAGSFPAPDEPTVKAMLTREKELRRSSATQRAYALRLTDSVTVSREIQIRVVREFGLPDEAIEVFESLSEQEGRGGIHMDHDVEVFGRMWNEPPDLHQQTEPTRTPEIAAAPPTIPMLSEIMPDIAIPSGPDLTIATAPPINQMLLREPELGDDHHHRRRQQQHHHHHHHHHQQPSPDKNSKKGKNVKEKETYTEV